MSDPSGVEYKQRLTVGVVVTCLVLSALSFGLRIYARTTSTAKLWYDDYWMCFVMLLCVGMSAGDFSGLANGSGQHQADLPRETMLSFMKNLYAYMILWALSVFSVKVGILLFYWRVFLTPAFRFAVVGVFSLSAGIFAGNFFSFMLQCKPIARFWDESIEGTCINQNAFYTASAIINVCGDVAVLFLPIPVIWTLHTSRNKKLSLSFLFLLGAFIFRIIAVKEIDASDFTFSNVAGGLWSTVEVEIGFICANLPAIRPLVARWLGKKDGSSGSSGATGSGYGGTYGQSSSAAGGGGGGGGGSNSGGYGMHSKISANRNGRRGDGDLELMSQGNSSDEINLTKSHGRPSSMQSTIMDSGASHSDEHSNYRAGGSGGGGGGASSGIRVKTEVQMTVDAWPQPGTKPSGPYTLPV